MSKIAFMGLGQMGRPMAKNLSAAFTDRVVGFDVRADCRQQAVAYGLRVEDSAGLAAQDADIVVLALPAAPQVSDALDAVLPVMVLGGLVIDCSTIDPQSARVFAKKAMDSRDAYVDSPMSGGIAGAAQGKLTFMVGGDEADFQRATPYLKAMGANIFHAGRAGAGAAAKLCNNMLLAISMIGVSEAIAMAEKLGLSAQRFYDISSTATGRCWSLNDYCPAPGPVPTAPSNNDYKPGFSVALMLKDLRLAQEAAQDAGAVTPLGAHATQLYALLAAAGNDGLDFSAMIKMMNGEK